MLSTVIKAFSALGLLLPLSAMANYIHWEMRNVDDPEAHAVMGKNFEFTGSFDYDIATGSIFNITLKTSTTDGCVACNDFSGDSAGQTFVWPSGQGGVEFTESYIDSNGVLYRNYYLSITGGNSFDGIWAFDVTKPGTYANLDIDHRGWIRLDDPLDPDMAESIGCLDCAYAIGTLVPAPEPETYAMMLAGLGILGWQVKRRKT